MSLVSIFLPSLNYGKTFKRLRELELAEPNLDYEVIVVSPFPVAGDKVVWVREGSAGGVVAAYVKAFEKSTGEFLVTWADDVAPTPYCIGSIVEFVRNHTDPFLAAFQVVDAIGNMRPPVFVYDMLYAEFHCFTRNTSNLVSGYYNSKFRDHWADPDFSLRVWKSGGFVETCTSTVIVQYPPEGTDEKYTTLHEMFWKLDLSSFLGIWHGIYGSGLSREAAEAEPGLFLHVP